MKKEAYNHVMKTVLGWSDDDPIVLAMSQLGYEDISDLETMSEDEIMELTCVKTERDIKKEGEISEAKVVRYSVPMKQRKMLLHVLWWRDYEAKKNTNNLITVKQWLELDGESFENFRCKHAANMARGKVGSQVTGSNDSGVTSNKVAEFQKGHKRDVNVYMKFAGDRKFWFRTKRNWLANAATDGIIDILSPEFNMPGDGSVAKQLFLTQNRYLYNVLQNCVKGGQALILVREWEVEMNGREAFLSMIHFYERSENLTLIRTQCMQELSNMKLTKNYTGGPLKFFQAFQNAYLDLENATNRIISDDEKIGVLNACLEDQRFQSVRTTVETLALQTGTCIDYASYL